MRVQKVMPAPGCAGRAGRATIGRMTPHEQQFLDALASAPDTASVARSVETLLAAGGPATPGFPAAMAEALYMHLRAVSTHPAFRAWLDVYFGRRRAAFRAPGQRPNFLYYPPLAPQAWFDTGELPELAPLQGRIAAVRDELLGLLAEAPGFVPYVEKAAERDGRWRGLADSLQWSARHLVRRGLWDDALKARLPVTAAFLAEAPLAHYPPHAPEAFVSRLLPGTELPPHHGLSNIKLTAHLPVDLPPGCGIVVDGETRTWQAGDFLVFDDSFLHSAWNRGEHPRTVLIMDIWHPGLDAEERRALGHAIAVLDQVRACTATQRDS